MDALHNPRHHMWLRLLSEWNSADDEYPYFVRVTDSFKTLYLEKEDLQTCNQVEPNEQDIREANKHQTATKESVVHANMTWASYSTHFEKVKMSLIKESLFAANNENDDIFSDVSEEKENTMRNEAITIIDPDAERRDYLRDRLYNIGNIQERNARVLFKIDGDPVPKSPKEFVERIKEGKFTFTSKYVKEDGTWRDGDKCYYGSSAELIEWRTAPADMEGYNAWDKADGERKTKIMDMINILTPEEALKAVQEYEKSPTI